MHCTAIDAISHVVNIRQLPRLDLAGNNTTPAAAALSVTDTSCRTTSNSSLPFPNYVEWSADGSALLDISESSHEHHVTVTHLQATADTNDTSRPSQLATTGTAEHSYSSSIYAAKLYPHFDQHNPLTHCYICSVKGRPLQLIDAAAYAYSDRHSDGDRDDGDTDDCTGTGTGRIRATYTSHSTNRDELLSPLSACFNTTGTTIATGFSEARLDIFDVNTSQQVLTYQAMKRKRKSRFYTDTHPEISTAQLHGMVSSLAYRPYDDALLAAGTYSNTLSLLDSRTLDIVGLVKGNRSYGITQLQFHPINTNYLFAAHRKHPYTECYDVRMIGGVEGVVAKYSNGNTSNQHINFDINRDSGQWLVTGAADQAGIINVYDLHRPVDSDSDGVQQPAATLTITGHGANVDIVNSVAFQPSITSSSTADQFRIAASVGTRHAAAEAHSDTDVSDSDDDDDTQSQSNASHADSRALQPGVFVATLAGAASIQFDQRVHCRVEQEFAAASSNL